MNDNCQGRKMRLPSLDGMRGIAILLVMQSHLEMFRPISSDIAWAAAHLGAFGVKMFFVLSGFLITTLLVNEYRETGHIALGRFLVRRAFRIFPAAYIFIATVVAASFAGWVYLKPGDVLAALTYTMNFRIAPAWWLGHTWSLSVEEQFYLAWPLALALVPRRGLHIACAALFVVPVARGLIILLLPALEEGIERSLLVAADGFAAGSLLATARERLELSPHYMRWLRRWWLPAIVPCAVVGSTFTHHPLAFYVLILPCVYLLLALMVHRIQTVTSDPLGRLLNWAPLTWLGSVSYSLYLWQQVFLAKEDTAAVQRFPVNILLSVACAWLSFHLIERPFLTLRDRWWPARSRADRPGLEAASPGSTSVVQSGA